MSVKDSIKKIYYSDKELTSEDFAYSRKMFLYEGTTANALAAICGGAFLAGFNNYLGVSDEISGIIAAIPIVTGVIQIFSSIIFEKIEKKKFLICISYLFSRVLLGFMYLVPLLVSGTRNRIIIMLTMYIASSAWSSFAASPIGAWLVDLIPNSMRGRYLGNKDAVSLVANTTMGLLMGWVLDRFRDAGNESLGFIVIGITVIILAIINFSFMSRVFEPLSKRNSRKITVKNVIIEPLKDINFRKVIIFTILYNIALQMAMPYFPIYMVTGLKLEYSYITMIGILSTGARVLFSKKWGRLADKTSWRNVTMLSVLLLGLNHISWIFINPFTSIIAFPVIQFIGGLIWAGAAIAVFNLPFMYLPSEGRTIYLSSNAAYGGIAGFLSTILGSRILALFKDLKFNIGWLEIGNMQVLFTISGLLLIVCGLYVLFFMKPEKKDA